MTTQDIDPEPRSFKDHFDALLMAAIRGVPATTCLFVHDDGSSCLICELTNSRRLRDLKPKFENLILAGRPRLEELLVPTICYIYAEFVDNHWNWLNSALELIDPDDTLTPEDCVLIAVYCAYFPNRRHNTFLKWCLGAKAYQHGTPYYPELGDPYTERRNSDEICRILAKLESKKVTAERGHAFAQEYKKCIAFHVKNWGRRSSSEYDPNLGQAIQHRGPCRFLTNGQPTPAPEPTTETNNREFFSQNPDVEVPIGDRIEVLD